MGHITTTLFGLMLLGLTASAVPRGLQYALHKEHAERALERAVRDLETDPETSYAILQYYASLAPYADFLHDYSGPDRSDWMAKLPLKIRQLPLSGIAIPGSHDSFTSTLDPKSEIGPSPDLSDAIIWILENLASFAKKIIYNWGVTQGLRIGDQLKAGIRYFDFRVAKRGSRGGDFYLLHSLYAQSMNSALEEVKRFIDAHPKEVVIIDINHCYGMEASDNKNLADNIINYFGDKLVARKSLTEITLEKLGNEYKQVIMFYHGPGCYLPSRDTRMWSGSLISSNWPNTANKVEALQKLDNWLPNHKVNQQFWVSQGILTPGAKEISLGVFSTLKEKLGMPICAATSEWVKGKSIGDQGVNIVITDFVEENNFIQNVINLNLK